jgi:plastocyanin
VVILTLLVALAGCSAQPSAGDHRAETPISSGESVTVLLSNFAFDPDHIRLMSGRPVLLRLVNESNGGHSFSAPTFFAASSFPPGSSAPEAGEIEVASHQTVVVQLIPHQPGTYPLKCTHALHDLFGMTGAIEVIP